MPGSQTDTAWWGTGCGHIAPKSKALADRWGTPCRPYADNMAQMPQTVCDNATTMPYQFMTQALQKQHSTGCP